MRWNVSKDSQKQSAYQILVASSQENINRNIADVWNSTKIQGNTKEAMKPKAFKPEKGKTYYWKIRIYDDLNRTGAYTKAQEI